MSLARDCLVPYIIWHEMMHALGFEHEHQRPDRDAYIRVQYSNVVPGQIGHLLYLPSCPHDNAKETILKAKFFCKLLWSCSPL